MKCDDCGAQTMQVYCSSCAYRRKKHAEEWNYCPRCGLNVYLTTRGYVANAGNLWCLSR